MLIFLTQDWLTKYCSYGCKCYSLHVIIKIKRGNKIMAKYEVKLSEEDLQMIKDCHSKNPSIMKAMNEAKKVED